VQTFDITDGPVNSQTHVVEPHGEIDLATTRLMRSRMRRVLDGSPRFVIVDLEDVMFIDSSGLGLLVSVERELKQRNGALIVVCPHPTVRRAFEITALDKVLNLQASLRDALLHAQDFAATTG
jgi:anti-sigma B factor antagonist